QGQIAAQLSGLIGQDGATAVQGLIKSASSPARGLIAGTISIVVLIIGATTVFAELQSALDRIWHVPEKEKPTGVWGILRARVLSFGLILGLAFLLMVSLVVSAGVAAFGNWTAGLLPGWELLLQGVNVLVSIGITTVLFAMIFKFMPTAPIRWHDVWIGAIVTAVLFEVGKIAIGIYLGKSGVNESFAAAGSLVVLLAWVYYAAQIFLLGAEFTKVYADEHGSAAGAKAVTATKVAAATADAGTDLHAAPAMASAAARKAGANVPMSAVVDSTAADQSPAESTDLARAAKANREVDQRIKLEVATLARKVVLLAVATAVSAAVGRWQKQQRQNDRKFRQQAQRDAQRAHGRGRGARA
ncbi:MAG: ribonuclease, partial [Variovorax sp.]|nr:ribonuclease [Variovorax sp.]